MIADPPFSRPYSVRHLGEGGAEVNVEANADERAALASDLGLVAIDALAGRFRLEGRPDRVRVRGRIEADVVQTCVLTLDPFPVHVAEEVDAAFREAGGKEPRDPKAGAEFEADLDAPDELVGSRIDLGAIAAEFLALGLDPYPRKPGAVLEEGAGRAAETGSPFAALAALPRRDG